MKSCPTCGMSAEDRASFCPCCGSSFVESQPTPPPSPPPAPIKKQPTPPKPVMPKLEEEKEGGHALPIVILSVLVTIAVGLGALWATGGLAAMLKKDAKADSPADSQTPMVESLPEIAATYGNGQELTTKQYLAYLYLEFENLYYNQGLYQYEAYGLNPWEQTFPYGDDDEELSLSDYIIRSTQDNIKRQIVLTQMMKSNGLSWIPEDLEEVNQSLRTVTEEDCLPLGFDHDSYTYALRNLTLNERSTFYGLYKAGGTRAVSELELRQYFVQNYVSYKMIHIPLTDQDGNALSPNSEAYEQILANISNYMTICQQNGFNAAYVLHTGQPAEDARVDADVNTMDAALAQAVRTVPIGTTSIVEYTEGGVPYVALIQRLDIYDSTSLFEESIEEILYEMHYEAFDAEVKEAVEQLVIAFDSKVVAEGKPQEWVEILENQ